jgi:hypothetical protein
MVIDSHSPDFTAPDNCAICNRPPADGVKMQNSGVFDGLLIECPQCGRYELIGGEVIWASFQWQPEFRCALSCAARQASESGQPVRINVSNAVELAEGHAGTRVNNNIDRLLQQIAVRSVRPGSAAKLCPDTDFTLVDCYSRAEFDYYIDWIKKAGLGVWTPDIDHLSESGAPVHSSTGDMALTVEGGNRVQPLPRPGGVAGRCFVAMWFSQETRAAYEKGIEPAVSESGFKPIRIDRKEHNNEIPDEIIAEIRNAQFMVADFTGQRTGVYYEAGFAMGLGRPVIWCCRRDEIGKLHFDTNHKNHIDWQTPQELRERLYTRIRMTILEQG